MNDESCEIACGLVSRTYIAQGQQALARRARQVKALLSSRRLPAQGWDEASIEGLISDLALMDSNNFIDNVGVGEREARVACPLVARRNMRLAHGIGRSGDIAAEQPKAAGSSLLAKLTNHLAADALRLAGMAELGAATVLPLSTGMTLALMLLALPRPPGGEGAAGRGKDGEHAGEGGGGGGSGGAGGGRDGGAGREGAGVGGRGGIGGEHAEEAGGGGCGSGSSNPPHPRPRPDLVLWSRIDQKTCLKCIAAAGLTAVPVALVPRCDELVTDVEAIARLLAELGPSRVAAVITTTSCFAPRAPDDVVAVARACEAAGVPHIINNAYGVQSAALCKAVSTAWRNGRVDAVVQSTDKNFMVPVGGTIVAAGKKRPGLVEAMTKLYPGRASASAHVDLLMTLLHWGVYGWVQELRAREELYPYLRASLRAAAAALGERVLATDANPISLAMTLDGLDAPRPSPPAPNNAAAAAGGADGPAGAGRAAAAAMAAAGGTVGSAGAPADSPAGPGHSEAGRAAAAGGEQPPAAASGAPADGPAGPGQGGAGRAAAAAAAAAAGGMVDSAGAPGAVASDGRGGAPGGHAQHGAAAGARGGGGARPSASGAPSPPGPTFLGSMLFARCVSGTRVVPRGKAQEIAGHTFVGYGSHTDAYPHVYLTAAAAIGTTKGEVDEFVARLTKAYREFQAKQRAALAR